MNSGSEQDCRALPTEIVAGNAGFVYDWCRKHGMIHDNGTFVWCSFHCREADLVLYVVDSSRTLDENDRQIIEMIRDQKVIVLLNKSDLEAAVSETDLQEAFGGREVSMIRTSAKKNAGIEEFEQLLEQMFFHGEIRSEDEVVITSMRHKEALCEAYDSLKMVQKSLEDDMPEDFYSIDLMSAYASLGRIIGEEVGDDLVNEIFSKFCMGK